MKLTDIFIRIFILHSVCFHTVLGDSVNYFKLCENIMKHMTLCWMLLCFMMLGSGCAVGQKIDLNHIPESTKSVEKPHTVAVKVRDARTYVVSGDKEQCFIGIYRAGFGNTWDVRTKNKVAFETIVHTDLAAALRQAGFTVTETNAKRIITVDINDYNFACYMNYRVGHKFSVVVKDPQGTILAVSEVMDETTVQGSFITGPKPAMEARLPQIYAL